MKIIKKSLQTSHFTAPWREPLGAVASLAPGYATDRKEDLEIQKDRETNTDRQRDRQRDRHKDADHGGNEL